MIAAIAKFAGTLVGQLSIVGGGIFALFGVYHLTKYEGVKQERARVQQEALKTDAKAQPARRAAEREPARVLERYYRD